MTSATRFIRILLIVSLSLNLLLGAAFATTLFQYFRQDLSLTRVPDLPSPRVLARHLEEHERARLRSILQAHRPGYRKAGGEVIEARRRVALALTSEPFNAAAMSAALGDLLSGHGHMRAQAQASLVELAEGMDAEGRKRLAQAILRPHSARGERHDPDPRRK